MCISIRILLGHTFFPYGYNIIADVLHIVINVGIHFSRSILFLYTVIEENRQQHKWVSKQHLWKQWQFLCKGSILDVKIDTSKNATSGKKIIWTYLALPVTPSIIDRKFCVKGAQSCATQWHIKIAMCQKFKYHFLPLLIVVALNKAKVCFL